MLFFSLYSPVYRIIIGFLIFICVLVATSSAADIQDDWLASVHVVWAEQDKEFKTSSTSPLAGVSRFEIAEADPVYFIEKEGGLIWSLEKSEKQVFSLDRLEANWRWTALDTGVTAQREKQTLPSGSSLKAGDELSVGRFTLAVYPSEDRITTLVFGADSQKVKDFETLERFPANSFIPY